MITSTIHMFLWSSMNMSKQGFPQKCFSVADVLKEVVVDRAQTLHLGISNIGCKTSLATYACICGGATLYKVEAPKNKVGTLSSFPLMHF